MGKTYPHLPQTELRFFTGYVPGPARHRDRCVNWFWDYHEL
jgi:hypothetical protein